MKRKLINADEFALLAKASGISGQRLAPSDVELVVARDSASPINVAQSTGRVISYKFSDQSVARDNHTVRSAGFELDNFRRNNVFLFAHDSAAPPVGKVLNIRVNDRQELVGDVEYVSRDLYPFGDMIFQMVKQRFLNAVSISWKALEWKFPTDKARQGGVDFLRQDLLEISQVPVPALATAVATARSAGIDTQPMTEWATKALDGGTSIVLPRHEVEQLRQAAGATSKTFVHITRAADSAATQSVLAQLKKSAEAMVLIIDGLMLTQSENDADGSVKSVDKFETPRTHRIREAEALEIAGRYYGG